MKIEHKKPVAIVVGLKLIADPNLTPSAKGVFAFLRALRPGIEFTGKEILKYNRIGQQGLDSALKELEEHGYLVRTESTWEVIDNPGEKNPVITVRKVESKPQKKTRQEWLILRTQQRTEFLELTKAALAEVKFDLSIEEVDRFFKYWTEIDSIRPEKPMPFQTKQTFNIKRRLRTWYNNVESRKQKGKL